MNKKIKVKVKELREMFQKQLEEEQVPTQTPPAAPAAAKPTILAGDVKDPNSPKGKDARAKLAKLGHKPEAIEAILTAL